MSKVISMTLSSRASIPSSPAISKTPKFSQPVLVLFRLLMLVHGKQLIISTLKISLRDWFSMRESRSNMWDSRRENKKDQ